MINAVKRSSIQRWAGVLLAATAVVAAPGCGQSDDHRGEGMGGMGLPQLSADERVEAEQVPFMGELYVDHQGCLKARVADAAGVLTQRWTVWPTGSELVVSATESGNGARVKGQVYGDGDRVTGVGQLVELSALPGGTSPGSYFEGSGRYCGALEGGVLVIADIRHT